MSKAPSNNPAGRLHRLLTKAAAKNGNRTFRQVWAEVFGVDPDDTGRLLSLLADLIHQIEDGKLAVSSRDELRDDLFLSPFLELEKAFSVINLNTKWQNWKKSHLKSETLIKLEFSADRLLGVYPEGQVDRDELRELQTEIEELLSSIRESEVPSELKRILIDGLEHVRRAIVEYEIRGAQGLKRALEQNLGTIFLHQQALADDQEAKGFTDAWLRKLQQLKTILDVAWRFKQLTPNGTPDAIAGLLASM